MLGTIGKAESEQVALVGGLIIDGTGQEPLENGVVVAKGAVIEEVGKIDKIKLPTECRIIDVSGKTVKASPC
jgi:N-acyl-D-aspartate/D-glutamate deacylase